MNRWGTMLVWVAIVVQVIWMAGHWLVTGHPGDKLVYDGFVVAVVAASVVTRGRRRWLNAVVRWMIGLAFLGSVGDRFGLLGASGDPGVSWGSWGSFVAYTPAGQRVPAGGAGPDPGCAGDHCGDRAGASAPVGCLAAHCLAGGDRVAARL